MKTVLLCGHKGYIGSRLFTKLVDKGYNVTGIGRRDIDYSLQKIKFDYLINAATPSRRFWAEQNPYLDYKETVEKTAHFYYTYNFDKFVQISSLSARTQLDTVYGRHKLAAENIIDQSKHLIFRLTATYDKTLTKGIIYDIIHGNDIYVGENSRYSFASLDYVCDKMIYLLEEGCWNTEEIGACDYISLTEIENLLKIKLNYKAFSYDCQWVNTYFSDAPKAKEVIDFIKEQMARK